MSPRRPHPPEADVLHVVLDDATVERLRGAAVDRGIELEQLIVHLVHLASHRIDEVLTLDERGEKS